jgi:hypothetical protein
MSDPESTTSSERGPFSCSSLTVVTTALAPKKVQPGGLACRRFRVITDPEGKLRESLGKRISLASFRRDFLLRDLVTERLREEKESVGIESLLERESAEVRSVERLESVVSIELSLLASVITSLSVVSRRVSKNPSY